MSQESEAILRNSLDAVDRSRRRAILAVGVLFVITLFGLGSLMAAAAARVDGSASPAKVLFTSVAAEMVFMTICTIVVAIYVTRMTKTILRAIDLMSRSSSR